MQRCLYVIDDDAGVRRSIAFLAHSAGLEAKTYESAAEFLEACSDAVPGCLVLDVCMPGMSGIELQQILLARGISLPLIFVTGHGDVPMCAQAMKDGAFDFLEKPLDPDRLLSVIERAMACDEQMRRDRHSRSLFQQRLVTLTGREQEVLQLVVAGNSTKQIAAQLGISIKTVDKHRAKVLEKMQVENAVELARLAMLAAPPARL